MRALLRQWYSRYEYHLCHDRITAEIVAAVFAMNDNLCALGCETFR